MWASQEGSQIIFVRSFSKHGIRTRGIYDITVSWYQFNRPLLELSLLLFLHFKEPCSWLYKEI